MQPEGLSTASRKFYRRTRVLKSHMKEMGVIKRFESQDYRVNEYDYGGR
jgi:hypothetical protein